MIAAIVGHAGHWTSWLLYAVPGAAFASALWWGTKRTSVDLDESWRDDPRVSDDVDA